MEWLCEKLATGPGAIYTHVASRSDLLNAACDCIVARTVAADVIGRKPQEAIRIVSMAILQSGVRVAQFESLNRSFCK
jgi:hypothetical protein